MSDNVATPVRVAVATQVGRSLLLNCSATGCPTPNVTRWTKQGRVGSLVTGNDRMLKYAFNAVKKEDAGNYTCTADNGIAGGPFTSTIFVDVQCKLFFSVSCLIE